MADFVTGQLMAAVGVMFSDGFFVAVLLLLIGRYMNSWLARYASGVVFAGILCSFLERPEESYAAYLLAGFLWVAVGQLTVLAIKAAKARRG